MLDTFKSRLKAKIKALGVNLSAKRMDALADRLHSKFPDLTEEADHDAKLDELNDVQPFSEIAAFDDYQRAKEAKEKKDKQQNGQQQSEGQQQQNEEQKKVDEVPEWAKALLQEVQTLKAEKQQSSVKQKLDEKLKAAGIPPSFYAKIPIPKEEELETFITDVTSDYDAFKQDMVNQGLAIHTKPAGGNGGGNRKKEASKEEVAEVLKRL